MKKLNILIAMFPIAKEMLLVPFLKGACCNSLRWRLQINCLSIITLAYLLGYFAYPYVASAQASPSILQKKGTELTISADKIIYLDKIEMLKAFGHVIIKGAGQDISTRELNYDLRNKEIILKGDIIIKREDGTVIYAQKANLSTQLARAFAKDIYIESKDGGYFFAQRAAQNDAISELNFSNASYSGCKTCQQSPRALWKISAKQIRWNKEKRLIIFKNSYFAVYDVPLLWLPYFQIADPSVKRKTGFLWPKFIAQSYLGYGVKAAFFFNLAPSYDLTLRAAILSKQGLLSELTWRERLNSGAYDITLAHIKQRHREVFPQNYEEHWRQNRFMLASQGLFTISDAWQYGWNILLQSDANFAQRFRIKPYNKIRYLSKIFLTGLGQHNFFDLSLLHFQLQKPDRLPYDAKPGDHAPFAKNKLAKIFLRNILLTSLNEPWALPKITYERQDKLSDGQIINSKFNSAYLLFKSPNTPFKGDYNRLFYSQSQYQWRKSFISKNGLVITPWGEVELKSKIAAYNEANYGPRGEKAAKLKDKRFAIMPSFGLGVKLPLLWPNKQFPGIIEPIGQIYISPLNRQGSSFADKISRDIFAASPVINASNFFAPHNNSGPFSKEAFLRLKAGIRSYNYSPQIGQLYSLLAKAWNFSPPRAQAATKLNYIKLNEADNDWLGLIKWQNSRLSLLIEGAWADNFKQIDKADMAIGKNWQDLSLSLYYRYYNRLIKANKALDASHKKQQEIGLWQNWRLSEALSFGLSTNYNIAGAHIASIISSLNYNNDCADIRLTYEMRRYQPGEPYNHGLAISLSLHSGKRFANL